MFVVLFLSMIFLASPARAFLTMSDEKTHNISDQDQNKNQSTPLVHQEQPREPQQIIRRQQTTRPQQPIQQQQTTQQHDIGHQSSPTTHGTQEMHGDRRKHRDHDEDRQKGQRNIIIVEQNDQIPAQFFNYGNVGPVQYNPETTSNSEYVDSLPADHLSVIVNGVTFAVYQDVFYKQTFSGYVVVDPTTLVSDGSFSISIQNSQGGYTEMQIRVVDNGFIGPQGEFYPQFPSIHQLQMLYVR